MSLEDLIYSGAPGWIFLKTIIYEIPKTLIPFVMSVQCGWGVIHYLQDNLHCWKLLVRCFSIGQLYSCYTKRPDISWEVMPGLFHDLRCHPAGWSDKCFTFLPFFERCWHTEVWYIHITVHVQQNISSFYISMYLPVLMEILQSEECLLNYSCYNCLVFHSLREI